MNNGADTLFSQDILGFARHRLEFQPDPIQSALLATNPHYCLLNCTRQWGKSTITAIKALHTAIYNEDALTLVLSPSERQSNEFINKVQAFLRHLKIKSRGDGKNAASVLLPNKSRIIGLPCRESTVRGFSNVALLLIDEAARVTDELYHSVRPMLAVSGGALWLISTPNGRRGFFFDEWEAKDPEWTRVSVPATECPRIKPSFLVKEKKRLSEFFFRQEHLCEFHDEGGQMISSAFIEKSLDDAIEPLPFELPPAPVFIQCNPTPPEPEPKPVPKLWPDRCDRRKYYVGIDFGKHTDHTAVAILEKTRWYTGPPNHYDYGRKTDFRFAIRHLERFPLGTPYIEVCTAIGRRLRAFPDTEDLVIIADATGIGDMAYELIRNLNLGRLIYPVMITSGDLESTNGVYYFVPKRDLIVKLAVQFEEGIFKIASRLPLASTLREELTGLGVRFSNSGNELLSTWRRDQHDDLVFAVALANWYARRDRWQNESRTPPR